MRFTQNDIHLNGTNLFFLDAAKWRQCNPCHIERSAGWDGLMEVRKYHSWHLFQEIVDHQWVWIAHLFRDCVRPTFPTSQSTKQSITLALRVSKSCGPQNLHNQNSRSSTQFENFTPINTPKAVHMFSRNTWHFFHLWKPKQSNAFTFPIVCS